MIRLDQIRICLEGLLPSMLATCGADGTPNITYVSQVHYVNPNHVALTFQFFNKTRQNILANPQATLLVIDLQTAAMYRLALLYRHTETSGPLFESMKARLAGIASSSGMENVFHLQGADVYQVMDIEAVAGMQKPVVPQTRQSQLYLREAFCAMSRAQDMAELFECCMNSLSQQLQIEYAMLLLSDETGKKLYTLDTRGYSQSGIGAEVPIGYGIIGTAAQYRTPIRITHVAMEYTYVQAMRDYLQHEQDTTGLETHIPFPGLTLPRSQLAMPILDKDKLLGIIYAESPKDEFFHYEHEDMLACLALFLGQMIVKLQASECLNIYRGDFEKSIPDKKIDAASTKESNQMHIRPQAPVLIRYYRQNHSIFLDQDYLIKGIAGAILWRLLQLHTNEGRCHFSNRELRLDPHLKLPDIDDNLEARLILLRRRLEERCSFMRLEKSGRGAFTLNLNTPLTLIEIDSL